MRYIALIYIAMLTAFSAAAQTKGPVISATSEWTPIILRKPVSGQEKVVTLASENLSGQQNSKPSILVLSDTFSDKEQKWPTGILSDYSVEVTGNSYRFRRRPGGTRPAFSVVSLPAGYELSEAKNFSVQVEISGDPSVIPEGSLLIGVRDSLNYTALGINSTRKVVIQTSGKDTATGKMIDMGGFVQSGRNLLRIEKRGDVVRFLVNGKEVPGSPYPFSPLPGNKIGVLVSGPWTVFRNLLVTVNP